MQVTTKDDAHIATIGSASIRAVRYILLKHLKCDQVITTRAGDGLVNVHVATRSPHHRSLCIEAIAAVIRHMTVAGTYRNGGTSSS